MIPLPRPCSMAQTSVAELTAGPHDDRLGIPTLQAFAGTMQHVVARHRVTGRIAGSDSRVQPIAAKVLRVARHVEQPISEDGAWVCAGPDGHCADEAGDLSKQ